MNSAEKKLFQDELNAFSSHVWEENSTFSFSAIHLTIKKDIDGQWYIYHESKSELILDSMKVPADCFVLINQHEHFLQVNNEDVTHLFMFAPTRNTLIELDGLTGAYINAKRYTRIFTNNKNVSGIENLDFKIFPSEFVGIYGESGIGKSVLINSILGTIRDGKVGGELFIGNENGERIQQSDISYLPQTVDIPKQLSCMEILKAAMIDRTTSGICDETEIINVLSRCSLDKSILNKSYWQISEGQKRRLCIASVLLKKHLKLLIADEPTTGLDVFSEEQVMETFRSISRSGITVLVVTHSVISAPIMDRVLVLKKSFFDHGAIICYDGSISKDQLDVISNALGGKNDKCEEVIPNNDYFFPSSFIKEKHNEHVLTAKKWLNLLCIYLLQENQWFHNVRKTIFRDKKGIVGFGILSFVCALAIQFGTNSFNGNNPENVMLTLFSLAAPWLCAMYAAISVSELNRYFAWEHFSGLRSISFLFGVIFAHAIPAFCIAVIFTLGLFISPRNCEIVKRWVCRDISQNTSNEEISKRLWFVKDIDNVPQIDSSFNLTEESLRNIVEEREEEIDRIKEERLDYIESCRDYASAKVDISQWYTPLKRGDAGGLDKAIAYSPIMTLYDDLSANYYYDPDLKQNISRAKRGNYPLAKNKARDIPKSALYVICIVLLIMWGISWIGGIIGITSAVILGNAKNAAVSIIVVFLFYILFSRIYISNTDAMFYLQPLDEISTYKSTIRFQDMGVIIPICCSFVCLGRYTSNLLAYAFTNASLYSDVMALCGMVLFCLLLSFVVLTRKTISK